ncbi:MAG TPA: PspC domain-containing protein [Pseudonocardiaceae bacterium]
MGGRPDGTPVMRRHRDGRVVGGVASGLADHLGLNVLWVRAAFALLAACAGAGLAAYAMLWVFVPQESTSAAEARPSQKERQQAFGLIALGISLAVAVGSLSGAVSTWVAVPAGVALVGAAVVWREADAAQRRRWVVGARSGVSGALYGGGGWTAVTRVLTGAVLVLVGIGVVLLRSTSFGQVQFALAAVLATLVGVAVLTVPWWIRLVRDLGDERRARIRTEERAEIAAHLHDSVLQTLALIQKQPEASREVLRLARGQERQLRSWLYGPDGYGAERNGVPGPTTLSQAIAEACGEVEDTFAIAVRPVVVGDCPMDKDVAALAQATREATVNAAKHSGADEISVYAEVEPDSVTVFVRDRGKGFDPDDVPDDRHGLADSIRGRMDRHGGSVKLRSTIGEGTEVQLNMPRTTVSTRSGN